MKTTKIVIGMAALAAIVGSAHGQKVPPGTYGGVPRVNVDQARVEAQAFRSAATEQTLTRWLVRARQGDKGTLTLRANGTYTWRVQEGSQIVEDQEGRWRSKPTEVRTMRRFARPAARVTFRPLRSRPVYDVGGRKPEWFSMEGADEWTTLYEPSFKYMDFTAESTGTVTMRLYPK